MKRFQQVSTSGGLPLRKKTRLAGSESNHRTAKAKIFSRNGRSRVRLTKTALGRGWMELLPICTVRGYTASDFTDFINTSEATKKVE